MDTSLLIGIIGTLATLVFGFLSIALYKRKRYPGKITYVKLSLIDLLNNVANNFNEIKLLHENLPINKNIIYIKGALLNNGDIDINSKVTEKDISIELPDKCKWLDIKPTAASKGLSASIKIDNNKQALFKFDLFRKNEFVQFEGLIEAENADISSDLIDSEIEFSHRIENTAKIEKKTLPTEKELKNKKRTAIIWSFGFLVILILFLLVFMFNILGSKKESVYFREINSKSNTLYSIYLKKDNVILEPIIGEGTKRTVAPEEFGNNYYATKEKLTPWQKFKKLYLSMTLYLGVFLILVLWELFEIRNARKLKKILSK